MKKICEMKMAIINTKLTSYRFKLVLAAMPQSKCKLAVKINNVPEKNVVAKNVCNTRVLNLKKRHFSNKSGNPRGIAILKSTLPDCHYKYCFRSQSTSGPSLPSLLNDMLKPNQVIRNVKQTYSPRINLIRFR